MALTIYPCWAIFIGDDLCERWVVGQEKELIKRLNEIKKNISDFVVDYNGEDVDIDVWYEIDENTKSRAGSDKKEGETASKYEMLYQLIRVMNLITESDEYPFDIQQEERIFRALEETKIALQIEE